MADGSIRRFNDGKGIGFIDQEHRPAVFIHHSGINGSGFEGATRWPLSSNRAQRSMAHKCHPAKGCRHTDKGARLRVV